jgi:hypothetical protein
MAESLELLENRSLTDSSEKILSQRPLRLGGEPIFRRNGNYLSGCLKMSRCKAPEALRSEVYLDVRCNDEGQGKRSRWAFFSNLL